MQNPTESYPKASAKGSYSYEKTVSLKALQAAFAAAFGGQDLALDHRVIFIHGVPATTKLPERKTNPSAAVCSDRFDDRRFDTVDCCASQYDVTKSLKVLDGEHASSLII